MSRTRFVYVLTNAGLPGHVKIGRTIRDTKLRADELWQEYGTVYPFLVKSKHMVHDCVAVETTAHRLLKRCRVPASEMFECDVLSAQRAIRKAAILTLERPWYLRLWHWIILPRPERAPRRWRRARRSSGSWLWLYTLAAAVLIIAGLCYGKPDLPDWLPADVARTAGRIESWP